MHLHCIGPLLKLDLYPPCTYFAHCQIILSTLHLKINESEWTGNSPCAININLRCCGLLECMYLQYNLASAKLCYCVCTAVQLNDLPLYCTNVCAKS